MQTARIILLAALTAAITPLSAQERESAIASMFDHVGRAIYASFERPFRPLFTTSVPGAGIGAGVALVTPAANTWIFDAGATISSKAFTTLSARAGYTSGPVVLDMYAQRADAPRLEYFGLGMSSKETERSSYRLRENVVGLSSAVRFTPWLAVGGRLERLQPDILRGRSRSLPATEDVLTEAEAPGLTRQPTFMRYASDIYFDIPAARANGVNQGGQVHLGMSLYDDRDLREFSFRRVDIAAFQAFAVAGPLRRLLLHTTLSRTTARGNGAVPFYLLGSLGGYQPALLAPYRNMDTIEPVATLRAFPNHRFRDQALLFMQAEYRHALWGPIEAALFADAGQVAPRTRDFALADLTSDMGVGFVLLRGPATAARVDLAVGREGARMLLRVGSILLP